MVDIAKQAGVTRSAVSRVLSGRKSTVNVSEATRERILKVAKELNYHPSILAMSLAAKRSFILGFLGRENYANQMLQLIKGIQDVTEERDYSLVTYYHGDTAKDELIHLQRSIERQVDGIIIIPALDEDGKTNAKEILSLYESGLPVVQMFTKVLPKIPAIIEDYKKGNDLACQHLIDLGHRRIAYLTREDCDCIEQPGLYTDAMAKVDFFQAKMREEGLEPIVITHPKTSNRFEYYLRGSESAVQILNHPAKPTAVITYNGSQMLGLVNAFQQINVRIPEDISVIGYDEINVDKLTTCPLTTLPQPLVQQGRVAAKMVFDMMEKKTVGDTFVATDIIVRGSAGQPRE
jgi:LacI family transcriptional regulator